MSTVRPHSKPPNYSKYEMGSLLNQIQKSVLCQVKRLPGWCRVGGTENRVETGEKKKRQRNMHGVGFPNATYWVCTQTGTNADLQREPSQLVQRDAFDQTHGAFSLVKSKALHEEQGLHIWDAAYTDTSLQSQERVSTTHHNLYPQFGVQSRNVNSSTFCLFCPFVSVRPSLQVSVFQVPVLEGEPLLLSLAPFLVVKVNVSALREQQSGKNKNLNQHHNDHKSVCGDEPTPVQTHRWWSWAPRASGTTSCTWCETSRTVSSEPLQTDTEPWYPEREVNKTIMLTNFNRSQKKDIQGV